MTNYEIVKNMKKDAYIVEMETFNYIVENWAGEKVRVLKFYKSGEEVGSTFRNAKKCYSNKRGSYFKDNGKNIYFK